MLQLLTHSTSITWTRSVEEDNHDSNMRQRTNIQEKLVICNFEFPKHINRLFLLTLIPALPQGKNYINHLDINLNSASPFLSHFLMYQMTVEIGHWLTRSSHVKAYLLRERILLRNLAVLVLSWVSQQKPRGESWQKLIAFTQVIGTNITSWFSH